MDTTDYSAAEQAASSGYSSISRILSQTGWSAVLYFAKLCLAIFLIWLIRKILNKISKKLEDYLEKKNLAANIRHFALVLIRYAILTAAVFYILTRLDIVEVSAIVALIGSAGVAISLAAQGTLSNLAGGLIMVFVRPFQPGDYISVPDLNTEGTVTKMELYYTTLEDLYQCEVKIPNSQLTNHTVLNLAHDYRKGLEIKVQVSYDADIPKAQKLLEKIASEENRILPGSAKYGVSGLQDSGVEIFLRCQVIASDYYSVRWFLLEQIHKSFGTNGIEIPYPQIDVHLKGSTDQPSAPSVK